CPIDCGLYGRERVVVDEALGHADDRVGQGAGVDSGPEGAGLLLFAVELGEPPNGARLYATLGGGQDSQRKMRLLAKEGAKRLRLHQGTHVLAVDREQALGARVLGMVGLCLLEYFV